MLNTIEDCQPKKINHLILFGIKVQYHLNFLKKHIED